MLSVKPESATPSIPTTNSPPRHPSPHPRSPLLARATGPRHPHSVPAPPDARILRVESETFADTHTQNTRLLPHLAPHSKRVTSWDKVRHMQTNQIEHVPRNPIPRPQPHPKYAKKRDRSVTYADTTTPDLHAGPNAALPAVGAIDRSPPPTPRDICVESETFAPPSRAVLCPDTRRDTLNPNKPPDRTEAPRPDNHRPAGPCHAPQV